MRFLNQGEGVSQREMPCPESRRKGLIQAGAGSFFRCERPFSAAHLSLPDTLQGSGNVWRDFGCPDADIRQAKRIITALGDRKLSTRKAAELTGFAAADFSRVRDADYGRFTLDRLIRMLHALDETHEVHVMVGPRGQPLSHPAPARR